MSSPCSVWKKECSKPAAICHLCVINHCLLSKRFQEIKLKKSNYRHALFLFWHYYHRFCKNLIKTLASDCTGSSNQNTGDEKNKSKVSLNFKQKQWPSCRANRPIKFNASIGKVPFNSIWWQKIQSPGPFCSASDSTVSVMYQDNQQKRKSSAISFDIRHCWNCKSESDLLWLNVKPLSLTVWQLK